MGIQITQPVVVPAASMVLVLEKVAPVAAARPVVGLAVRRRQVSTLQVRPAPLAGLGLREMDRL